MATSRSESNYQMKKAEIREKAIDWQASFSEPNYSYGDIVYFQNYFTVYGKMYGLLTEFRENGIL